MHAQLRLRAPFVILVIAVLAMGIRSSGGSEPLSQAVTAVTELPRFKHAHWGLFFVDLATGEVVLELNADKLFAPASTTKLYSVACALDALGSDYRFLTPIHRRGTVNAAGELDGDLILVASGDLSFGGRTNEKGEIAFTNHDHTYANGSLEGQLTASDPLAGVADLARQVAGAGIKRVRGDLLVDDRLFEKNTGSGSGPSRLTPIMVNDNVVDVMIEPTEPGQPARLIWRPTTAAIHVEGKCDTVSKDKKLEVSIQDLGNGKLRVNGHIPAGHKPLVRVHEVPDAAAFARTLLIEALQSAGVAVDSAANMPHRSTTLPAKDEYKHLPVVAKLISPPFSESARLILKVSHNLHASTLPLLVATKHGERTLSEGLRRQRDFLSKTGLDVGTISFGGGAGGARSDFVTPRATVQLLRHMSTRPDFPVYYRALPKMGVDGTLASAVKPNSPARDKVHAKTGTLLWENVMNGGSLLTSKALAGYMDTARGKKLAFALFVNNVHLRDGVTATTVGQDLGRISEIIYQNQ